MIGRNIAHERLCVPLVRARRAREGKPPAEWVLTHYRQNRRIAAWVKEQIVAKYFNARELNIWACERDKQRASDERFCSGNMW